MKQLLYVSPQFPSLSMVFEQNEILGIQAAGTDVTVLSCRKPSQRVRRELHEFAAPLLKTTIYASYGDVISGLAKALARQRGALVRIVGYMFRSVRNPTMVPKVVAAFALALSWYHRFDRQCSYHVHADFGQNSASAALFLATLLDAPFSYKVHAFDIFSTRWRHRDPLRNLKMQKAAVVVSEHGYGRRLLEERVPTCRDKIVVNYSSVRTDEFRPLAWNPDSRSFVALGRLVPKKGFDVLIAATAHLLQTHPDVTIDVYGAGPEEQRLRAFISEYGVDNIVRLHGTYDNSELPAILNQCLAVVVPSVADKAGDMDGIPTVVYESLALGRPVIASAISGIPEVVSHGETGLLVRSGDSEDLAAAMATILDAPTRAEHLATAGRRLVEERHDHIYLAKELLRILGISGAVIPGQGSEAVRVGDQRYDVDDALG